MPRGVSDIDGLRNVGSMHSTGKRSIPRVASSAYLDLYMLRKEKDRLEKEDAILEKRKAGIQKRLEDIKKEMEVLEKADRQEKGERTGYKEEVMKETESREKKWKKMGLSY
ncbi:hypothetical protein B9J78_04800 [bacterium Unc6]|nr:hypothetical protein [bacterium Unc6]MBT9138608.1 hypothetical protein [Bacillota bacterium]